MARYNLYEDGQYHAGVKLLAIEAGSELDQAQAVNSQVRFVAAVETESFSEISPNASTFQTNNRAEYISTGLHWPNDQAVVVK